MQLLITGFYSYENTWPIDPLTKKELVHRPRSQRKSWSKDPAHEKRAGRWTPLKKKELIINSYSQLF
jgi:hypothetical protein